MSFYIEYLRQMGMERLLIEQRNIDECIEIAKRSRYSPDIERLSFKRVDIINELARRQGGK